MKKAGKPCEAYRERLIALCFGATDRDAEAHVADCRACREWLGEMKRIMEAAKLERFEPPEELVEEVKSWATPKAVQARPIRSSLGLVGARRGQSDAFQVLLDADGEAVRVAYSREGSGWIVLVEAPPTYGTLLFGRKTIAGSNGRFRFAVRSLARSGFTLRSPFRQIEIPPVEEAE